MRLGPMLIPIPSPCCSAREKKNRKQCGCSDPRVGLAKTGPPCAALRKPGRRAPGESSKQDEPNFRQGSAQQNERPKDQVGQFRKEGGRFHGVNSPVDPKSFSK